MPYVTVNAARLYYEQHGSGPDVVFLHGAGGNHLVWWQQVAAFSREFRCTTFDARGWGLSRGEMAVGRFSLGTDLVALLERLDIGRAHIIAQSMGGRAVAGLSRLAPQRALWRHHTDRIVNRDAYPVPPRGARPPYGFGVHGYLNSLAQPGLANFTYVTSAPRDSAAASFA